MITVQKYSDLGTFRNDWLDAHYHFSFANYYNPARMGLGPLRVINDDTVRAGQGFGFHPHKDMEIISYIRSGAIHHKDNLGNSGVTTAGNIQVMSAGTGIVHAEYSAPETDTRMYQIWIEPDRKGVAPRWENITFDTEAANTDMPLRVLASGRTVHEGLGVPVLYQDAALYGGQLAAGQDVTLSLSDKAYGLVSQGTVTINGETLSEGDGITLVDEKTMTLHAETAAEVIMIDVGTL